MKFINLTCTQCGATMKVDENTKTCNCSYCGNTLYVDNEDINININFEDGYQFGKEFERGRQEVLQNESNVELDKSLRRKYKFNILNLNLQSSIKILVYTILCFIIAYFLLNFIPSVKFVLITLVVLIIVNLIFKGLIEKNFWWLAFVLLCIIEINY